MNFKDLLDFSFAHVLDLARKPQAVRMLLLPHVWKDTLIDQYDSMRAFVGVVSSHSVRPCGSLLVCLI